MTPASRGGARRSSGPRAEEPLHPPASSPDFASDASPAVSAVRGCSAPARPTPANRRAARAGVRHREIALAAAIVLTALAVRVPFLAFESFDFRYYFHYWYDFIALNGYFHSWQHQFADYNPPYLYLLTAAAYFVPSVPALFAVKTISILGDSVLALFSYRCVRFRYPGSRTIPLLASGAVLLAPTVVLNSAWWGQVDAIYTAFLMACLYGLLNGQRARAFAAFGIALVFKAQAVFLAPLLYWLSEKRTPGGRYFWPIPAIVLAAVVPAWAAGRSLFDLLSVYAVQVGYFSDLNRGAPNLYRWISNDHYRWWPAGVLLTFALVHGVRRLLESRCIEMTRERIVFLALFSVLLMPFFLPKMLDRYFFPADVFAIVLAFYRPRLWYVPVVVGAASLTAYAYSYSYSPGVWLGWAAALVLAVLADLTRRLLLGLGFRFDLGAARRWLMRRARAARAAAAPLAVLLLAFAALFTAVAADGRLGRPLRNDGESARTLARALERSPDRRVSDLGAGQDPLGPERGRENRERDLRAYRAALDAEGRIVHEAVPGGSAAFDHLLAAVLRHFDDDLGAQVAAARAVVLALLCGAALFAYLSLCRVLAFRWPARRDSNRWIALAATLLGFGSAAAAGADTVAVSGAPEVFGLFCVFHATVVFLGERRFGQLLGKGAAALLLGFGAAALLVPFVTLGAVVEWRRRRAGEEGATGAGNGTGGRLERFLGPVPAVSLRKGPVRSPYLALGVSCAVLAALLAAAGAVGGASGGAGAGGGPPGPPAGNGEGAGVESAAFGASLAEGLRRIGHGFWPPAALPGGSAGEGAKRAGAAAGALLAAVGLAGAVLLRSFPLLVLALSGLVSALWLGRGAPAEVAALGAPGLPLAAWTAGFAGLRGRWGAGWACAAAGAAVVVWVSSFAWAGVLRGGDGNLGRGAGAPEARAANDRLREDIGRIRRVLRRREERTVFLPRLEVGGDTVAGGARARFFLPEAVVTDDPARRAFAEFTVETEPGSARGLLTPRNREVFLYHRAAYDGELDGLVEAAGAPAARSEFDVHLGGGRLLFVKNDCRPEHLEGYFIVHLVPEDPDDLPPHRRQYGFENLSFRFVHRAYETGERCVAGVRFPEYPIRSVRTGRSLRQAQPGGVGRYDPVWREEFAPSDRGAAGEPSGARPVGTGGSVPGDGGERAPENGGAARRSRGG